MDESNLQSIEEKLSLIGRVREGDILASLPPGQTTEFFWRVKKTNGLIGESASVELESTNPAQPPVTVDLKYLQSKPVALQAKWRLLKTGMDEIAWQQVITLYKLKAKVEAKIGSINNLIDEYEIVKPQE